MNTFVDMVLPILALAVIILVVLTFSKKRDRNECHYDEMQLKFRADGYRLGFFVTLFTLLILIFLTECLDTFQNVIKPSFGMFVAAMAGIVTFVVYCIRKDAFYSIGQNRRSYMLLCVAVIIANGIGSIRHITERTLLVDGALTFSNSSGIVCALSFLIILCALVVKQRQEAKESSGEMSRPE